MNFRRKSHPAPESFNKTYGDSKSSIAASARSCERGVPSCCKKALGCGSSARLEGNSQWKGFDLGNDHGAARGFRGSSFESRYSRPSGPIAVTCVMYSLDFAQWKWDVSPGRTMTLPGGYAWR